MAPDRTHCCLVVLSVLVTVSLILTLVSVTLLVKHDHYYGNKGGDDDVSIDRNTAFDLDYSDASKFTAVSLEDLRRHAAYKIPKKLWVKIEEGVLRMRSVAANEEAFRKYQIMPSYLTGNTNFTTQVTILGTNYSIPIGLAPTAYQKAAHPDCDIASAKAALSANTILGVSATASTRIEDIMKAYPSVTAWQQVYLFDDRDYTLGYIRRAETAGVKAFFVTVDNPFGGYRYDSKRKLAAFPPQRANSLNFTLFKSKSRGNAQWAELSWLRQQTSLPIILKGIQNVRDVRKIARAGCQGLVVSNHGGRSMDEVPASIDVLADVAEEARKYSLETYMDGGIRTGADVFKALALGAKMVFVGRPIFWGLAHSGADGVSLMLDILTKEFISTAKQVGAMDVQDIDKSFIWNKSG